MRDVIGSLWGILIGVLLLGAVITVGYKALQNNKASNAISGISQLTAGVESLYNGQGTYASLTNTVALNAGLVPQDMNVGGVIQDPWAGAVTLAPDATPSMFDITLASVPAAACASMATTVKGVAVTLPTGGKQNMPVDAGTAATDCAAGGSVTFVFGQ